ncbi:MAG: DUF4124 domain-containing protein [Proteobacteria bacterium]|nr:DUF4124 domain-containing protein [Pseudomonadota bacterium]MCL2308041.1 DUF4124 domain-containing protein [Pseudomonadota bacterium]
MKTIVFILVALFASVANATVYKCTSADGKVEFSDKPCAGMNSERMYLPNNTFEITNVGLDNATTPAAVLDGKSAEASNAAKTAEATKRANERRFIRAGMTATDVRSRIGSPDSREVGINCGWVTASGETLQRTGCECWVYDPTAGDPQTRTDVCFHDGLVTSVTRKVVR